VKMTMGGVVLEIDAARRLKIGPVTGVGQINEDYVSNWSGIQYQSYE
jgi:hypothetical protein